MTLRFRVNGFIYAINLDYGGISIDTTHTSEYFKWTGRTTDVSMLDTFQRYVQNSLPPEYCIKWPKFRHSKSILQIRVYLHSSDPVTKVIQLHPQEVSLETRFNQKLEAMESRITSLEKQLKDLLQTTTPC